MAVHEMMVLDMTGFSATEDWSSTLGNDRFSQAKVVMDKHLGNPQHDAEVTLETASCLTNPANVIDAAECYARIGRHSIYHC